MPPWNRRLCWIALGAILRPSPAGGSLGPSAGCCGGPSRPTGPAAPSRPSGPCAAACSCRPSSGGCAALSRGSS
eukprot:4702634-Alexandrium_andersonii.AAC.1